MNKQTKRKYSPEFKKEAVQLVTEQGYSIAEAARNLGIRANMLGRWKSELAEQTNVDQLGHDDKAELKRLQKENRRLKMEREILKKAAAFFANETK